MDSLYIKSFFQSSFAIENWILFCSTFLVTLFISFNNFLISSSYHRYFFPFDSTFLICKKCVEAYGQYTEHNHDGKQEFAKVRFCFVCQEASTSMKRHKNCTETIRLELPEVTFNFKALMMELRRRTRMSK